MPDGDSRDWVTHPGPESPERYTLAPCHARQAQLRLSHGNTLLDAVAQAVEAEGADGACAILDGVALSQMRYVMPDGPADETHAAWYSDTYHARNISLDRATASVGKKDGEWFLHTHAMWLAETPSMGHLLNDQCILEKDCTITAWLTYGARLEVSLDPETQFPLFRPERLSSQALSNAALLTIRPHTDLRETLEIATHEAGFSDAQIHGLGSLIGAGFVDAPPMSSTLSEVLLLERCRIRDKQCLALPLACVDPTGQIYQGDLVKAKGPVLVTFETLIVANELS